MRAILDCPVTRNGQQTTVSILTASTHLHAHAHTPHAHIHIGQCPVTRNGHQTTLSIGFVVYTKLHDEFAVIARGVCVR